MHGPGLNRHPPGDLDMGASSGRPPVARGYGLIGDADGTRVDEVFRRSGSGARWR